MQSLPVCLHQVILGIEGAENPSEGKPSQPILTCDFIHTTSRLTDVVIFYANENRKLTSSSSRIIMAAALAGDRFYLFPVRGCGLFIIPGRITNNNPDPD